MEKLYWDEVKRTRPHATRLDSGLRALSVGEMKSQSDPEGKASQINAPHTDHGLSVADWVSPKHYDPHFQSGGWEAGPRSPELESVDPRCGPRHYHYPHYTEERPEVHNLEKVRNLENPGGSRRKGNGC